MIEISIIIPTYNERDNLEILFQKIREALTGYSYEVIIVDDGSPDGTGQLAEELSKEYPVKVIQRGSKKGLASAVIDGFSRAEGEILCVIDADLQHPPEKISSLLKEIKNGNDIAIASRYIGSNGIEKWNFTRKIISVGAKSLVPLMLPRLKSIKDPLSGFFIIRRDVIDGIKLNPIGYKILLEILVKGRYKRAVEIPYIFQDRNQGRSKLNKKEQINYLLHLYRLAKVEGEIKRLIRFSLVGASGIIVNEGLLYLMTERVGLSYLLISSVFAIQASILSNFTFNYLWTFKDRRGSLSLLNRLGKFELVCIGGLLVNLIVLFTITSLFGINYLISNLIAIAMAFTVNFIGSNHWAWSVNRKS